MENREQVVKEYFQLLVKLNTANKLPNEHTKLRFIITQNKNQDFQLRAIAGNNAEPPSILLCICRDTRRWNPSFSSGLHALEEFLAIELRKMIKILYQKNKFLLTESSAHQLENLIETIVQELGIPKHLK